MKWFRKLDLNQPLSFDQHPSLGDSKSTRSSTSSLSIERESPVPPLPPTYTYQPQSSRSIKRDVDTEMLAAVETIDYEEQEPSKTGTQDGRYVLDWSNPPRRNVGHYKKDSSFSLNGMGLAPGQRF